MRVRTAPEARSSLPSQGDAADGGHARPRRPQPHLDFDADDLDEAAARLVEWGATVPETQPRPDRWRVVLDPAGPYPGHLLYESPAQSSSPAASFSTGKRRGASVRRARSARAAAAAAPR
ncbi:VOC family protein [Streptomyces venezuelae]|uniref:VOC family protein n=1 Tax=Streptomyces TaxID=1883 RepID=UPI003988EE8E